MDEKPNEKPNETKDPKVMFVEEYNKLVEKYGFNIVPTIRLELNNVKPVQQDIQNKEASKIIKAS